MPGVRTIWQKAVELRVRKVNEVVHGAQGADLVVVMSSTTDLFFIRRLIGVGKEFVQRRIETFALSRRDVICHVPIATQEHLIAQFGEGGVVGIMGRMDDEGMTSFRCVIGGNMPESRFYHP